MLANTIKINVIDRLQAIHAVVRRTYTRFREELDKTTYTGPLHTASMRDLLQVYRSAAKRAGESRGVQKSEQKLTRDVSVANASGTGTIVQPLIVAISWSVPVGCPDADVAEMVNLVHGLSLDPTLVTGHLYDPAETADIYGGTGVDDANGVMWRNVTLGEV